MDYLDWIILPLIGAVGGFLAGMLGVGGGIIFVPVLTWYFNRLGMGNADIVKYTLANSIFLVFVSGVSGIIRQSRVGKWDYSRTLFIGIPGALTALVWSYFVEKGHWYRKEDFQLVFLAFLIISISNMVFGKKDHAETIKTTEKKRPSVLDIVVALLAGTVVALSGLGGGVIMVPMFRMMLKMPMRSATGLSLSIIPLLSLFPLVNYLIANPPQTHDILHTGYLVWPVALPISIGVAVFAGIGLKVATKVPVLYLRVIFALLSTIILIKTLLDILN